MRLVASAALVVAVAGGVLGSMWFLGMAGNACAMQYSYPQFLADAGRQGRGWDGAAGRREVGGRYSLVPFRNARRRDSPSPLERVGVPALFVPGNRGDFRQARSLGAATEERTTNSASGGRLDWFVADTAEEAPALVDAQVKRQLDFIADATRELAGAGASTQPQARRRVLVVGHSVGGSLAIAAVGGGMVNASEVAGVVTVAAPLARLPLLPGRWSTAADAVVRAFLTPESRHQESVPLLAFSGGGRDAVVPPALSEPSGIASPSGCLVARQVSEARLLRVADVPGVGFAVDHLAVVWCKQLVSSIASACLSLGQSRGGLSTLAPAAATAEAAWAACSASLLDTLPPNPPGREQPTLAELVGDRERARSFESSPLWTWAAELASWPARFAGSVATALVGLAILSLRQRSLPTHRAVPGATPWRPMQQGCAASAAVACSVVAAAWASRAAVEAWVAHQVRGGPRIMPAGSADGGGVVGGVATSPFVLVLAATDSLALADSEGWGVALSAVLASAALAAALAVSSGALLRTAGRACPCAGRCHSPGVVPSDVVAALALAVPVCSIDLAASLVTRDSEASASLAQPVAALVASAAVAVLAPPCSSAALWPVRAGLDVLGIAVMVLAGRSVWLARLALLLAACACALVQLAALAARAAARAARNDKEELGVLPLPQLSRQAAAGESMARQRLPRAPLASEASVCDV